VIPSFWCMRCRASPPPKFFILYFPDSIRGGAGFNCREWSGIQIPAGLMWIHWAKSHHLES
jgi:hypothetical protein